MAKYHKREGFSTNTIEMERVEDYICGSIYIRNVEMIHTATEDIHSWQFVNWLICNESKL